VPKKSLYQTLQVGSAATPEAIKAAYEARLAPLQDNNAPEAKAERVILREAYELLSDPARRKQYDEKLKRDMFQAMSSGGEVAPRPRPASVQAGSEGAAAARIAAFATLGVIGIAGTWFWLDHRHTQRIEAARAAEEARQEQLDKAERAKREAAVQSNARIDAQTEARESRSLEIQRQQEINRLNYERQRQQQQQLADQRRAEMEQRRAEMEQRRQEQEEARRSQQQLQRDQRYLQELERNRGMSIPQR